MGLSAHKVRAEFFRNSNRAVGNGPDIVVLPVYQNSFRGIDAGDVVKNDKSQGGSFSSFSPFTFFTVFT